jgi:hypothetical protein
MFDFYNLLQCLATAIIINTTTQAALIDFKRTDSITKKNQGSEVF